MGNRCFVVFFTKLSQSVFLFHKIPPITYEFYEIIAKMCLSLSSYSMVDMFPVHSSSISTTKYRKKHNFKILAGF